MAEDQGQARKRSSEQTSEDAEVETTEVSEADLSEVDDLLDEIDAVLEENAEEFVKNYVQKGGQ
ncbi:MAG: ubiquitin-like protein Pup [Acidimicrobiia bacterium]|nr:ubiquitin-like protein Pup [Acidimicrobiia bacterium]